MPLLKSVSHLWGCSKTWKLFIGVVRHLPLLLHFERTSSKQELSDMIELGGKNIWVLLSPLLLCGFGQVIWTVWVPVNFTVNL